MRNISYNSRIKKTDFRKLTSSERYQFRIRAVTLVRSGKKQKEVASLFGVRTATVSSWMKACKHEGNIALRDNTRGVKTEDKRLLSATQVKQIQKIIISVMPHQLKIYYALRTRKAVKDLVEREFGVVLAINTM